MILKRDRILFNLNPTDIILTGIVLLATTLTAYAQTSEKSSEPGDTTKVAATPTPAPTITPTATPTPSPSPTPKTSVPSSSVASPARTPAVKPASTNNQITNTNSPNPTPQEPDPFVVLTAPTPTPTPVLTPKLALTTAQVLQERLAHARASAVLGNFQAAANELVAVRAQTTDPAIRDVASIILLGVQIKTGVYGGASAMLQEAFNARAKNNQSRNLFFSLTGQMLHSMRLRLDRYREFGVMTTDRSAPDELRADLDGMRTLIEQAVEQAQQINDEEGRSLDVSALIEDAASLRMALARDGGDRSNWQREVAEARVQLAAPDAKKKKTPFLAGLQSNSSAASSPTPNALTSGAAFQPPNIKANTSAPTNTDSNQSANVKANANISTGVSNNPNVGVKNNTASQNDGVTISNNVAAPQTVAVGSLIEKATQRIAPTYPSTARNAHVAGTVTVYVVVDEKGEVKDVQKATGPDLLRTAAQDAARRWRFQPTYINGQPVRVSGFVTFNFTL